MRKNISLIRALAKHKHRKLIDLLIGDCGYSTQALIKLLKGYCNVDSWTCKFGNHEYLEVYAAGGYGAHLRMDCWERLEIC